MDRDYLAEKVLQAGDVLETFVNKQFFRLREYHKPGCACEVCQALLYLKNGEDKSNE